MELTLLGGLLALLPMSLYGEGLRRALLRFSGRREAMTAWRGRLSALPLLLLAPVLLYPLLLAAERDGRPRRHGRARAPRSAGSPWASTRCCSRSRCRSPGASGWSAAVASGWRRSSPGRCSRPPASPGFLQGFVLFLSLPLDLGAPFGGLDGRRRRRRPRRVAVPAAPRGADRLADDAGARRPPRSPRGRPGLAAAETHEPPATSASTRGAGRSPRCSTTSVLTARVRTT